MRITLIENWRDWWKFWSVKATALLALLEAVDLGVNAFVESGLAPAIVDSQAFGCFKLAVTLMIPLLRLIQQKWPESA